MNMTQVPVRKRDENICCRLKLRFSQPGDETDLEASEPVIFMKPDTALLRNGNPFFLPDFSDEIHYEN
jgi:2-keto-4-pentenoate hydratase/2-oxohepta-3-ene-1,7-dioic acid hydratase in catechol pathway